MATGADSRSALHSPHGGNDVHDVLGVTHRILVGSEQSDGATAVVEVTVPPGTGAPPHTEQREALVWYVIDGVLDFDTEGGPLKLDAGAAVFMERNSRHGFANTGDRPARAVMVAVPGGIENFFREAASVLPAGPPAGPPSPQVREALAQVARRHGVELDETSIPA